MYVGSKTCGSSLGRSLVYYGPITTSICRHPSRSTRTYPCVVSAHVITPPEGKEVRPVEDLKVPAHPKGDDRQSQSKGKGRVHRQGGDVSKGEPYPRNQQIITPPILPRPPDIRPGGKVTQFGVWPHLCDENLSDPSSKKTI